MRFRHHLLVYLFYLAVTLLITYPLITVIGTRMIGHPFSDAYEYTHHIWWIKTALQTGQNPFYEPNIVYPDGANAVLLWSLPLQSFPAWLFLLVMPLPLAFNLSALLTLALNGWAMFFLVRHLLRTPRRALLQSPVSESPPSPRLRGRGVGGEGLTVAPALVAGLTFMLYPALQGQLGAAHTGLLTLWPAPLYFYMLLRLRDVTHVRRTILAGALLFMISLWGSELLLIYLLAPITALYFLTLMIARHWIAFRRALVIVILGAIFSAPFIVPLAIDTLHVPPEAGSVTYSATLLGIISPSFYHPLFSQWGYNRRVLGVDPFEQASYIGVLAALIALIALWKRREARGWLLLALIAWIFSLGPLLKVYDEPLAVQIDGYATHITLPWALFQNLPLISIARTPARFNFTIAFAVAIMVGYGAATIFENLRSRSLRLIALILLMALIAFDDQFWWPLPTIPGIVPAPIAALSQRTNIRAVLDIPWQHPLVNKDGMFLQTGHRQPMIVGQIARQSPANPAKVNLLQDTLDPSLLNLADVDIVILHRDYAGDSGKMERFIGSKLGKPLYEDAQYAVFQVAPYHGDPPGLLTDAQGDNLYFYAPQTGSATLTGTISAGDRGFAIALDGTALANAQSAPIRFAAGYHAITISNDPPCPTNDDPVLTCPPLTVTGLALTDYQTTNGGS